MDEVGIYHRAELMKAVMEQMCPDPNILEEKIRAFIASEIAAAEARGRAPKNGCTCSEVSCDCPVHCGRKCECDPPYHEKDCPIPNLKPE